MDVKDFIEEERRLIAAERLGNHGLPVLNHIIAREGLLARLEEYLRAAGRAEPSYVVIWTYTDQFGKERREQSGAYFTKEKADEFAKRKLTGVDLDADWDSWWIEERRVVEYHDPVRDAQKEA